MEDSFNVQEQHLFSYAKQTFETGSSGYFTSDYEESNYSRSPSADQIFVPLFDMDTKWRSLAVAHHSPSIFESHGNNHDSKRGFVQRPELKKANFAKKSSGANVPNKIEIIVTPNCYLDLLISENGSKPPSQYFDLLPANFEINCSLEVITESIEQVFINFPGISYEYVADEFCWNAIHLRGSSHCRLQIKLYSSNNRGYIIEGNRLSGDGTSFRTVFNELKVYMNAPPSGKMECESSYNSSSCISSEFLSDEDVLKSMKPIMNMALSGKIEAKLEASRLLCELSLRDDMHQYIIESGCLRVLVEILLPSKLCEWTPRHAINALGNLADAETCQGAMIASGVLPMLISLAIDGPYNILETSRESARILAVLTTRSAQKTVEELGYGAASTWMESVDFLKDDMLKLHSGRAKENLKMALPK